MSNSQKYIFVVSILNIIAGVICAVFGCLYLLGLGVVGNQAIVEHTGDATAPALALAFAATVLIGGALMLLVGILGVRAARDAKKIGPVLVLSCISFVLTVIGLIGSLVTGSFNISQIPGLVAPALMFWCANNVKKQAGI